MVKCKNCGFENEKMIGPVICPVCGHIATPHTKKKTQKEKGEQVKEPVELIKLID